MQNNQTHRLLLLLYIFRNDDTQLQNTRNIHSKMGPSVVACVEFFKPLSRFHSQFDFGIKGTFRSR